MNACFRSLLLGCAASACLHTLSAANVYWDGSENNDWFFGLNWTGNFPPSDGDDVYFQTGDGTTVSLSNINVTIDDLYFGHSVNGDYTLTLSHNFATSPTLTNDHAAIGHSSGKNGYVTLSNSAYWLGDSMELGRGGLGSLTIGSNALFELSTYMSLGSFTSGEGILEVSGTLDLGTNLNVGFFGEGDATFQGSNTSSIGSELRIGYDDQYGAANGTVTISSSAEVDVAGATYVGRGGVGNLTIQNSGVLDAEDDIFVAQLSGSTGEINTTHSNTRVYAPNIYFGGTDSVDGGTATLDHDKGRIYIGNRTSGLSGEGVYIGSTTSGTGAFLARNAATIQTTGTIEAANNSQSETANITLLGGSSWTHSGNVEWSTEGNSVVSLTDSTFSANGSGTWLSYYSGAELDISLENSEMRFEDSLYIGYNQNNGSSGTLTLSIDDDSTLFVGDLTAGTTHDVIRIGKSSSGNATLTLDDVNLSFDTGSISIGGASNQTGTLALLDDGKITLNDSTNGHVYVGGGAGSGSATLTMDDAFLTTVADVKIGALTSTGTVQLTNDSHITANNLQIGNTGTGSVAVDGASSLQITNDITAGSGTSGTSSLDLDNADLTATNMTLGKTRGFTGTFSNGAHVDLTGTLTLSQTSGDSTLTITDSETRLDAANLVVGNDSNGSATFDIQGGEVRLTTGVHVGDLGVLAINGGSLYTPSITRSSTSGQFAWNSGYLQINGGTAGFENQEDFTLNGFTLAYNGADLDHSNYDLTIGSTSEATLKIISDASFTAKDVFLGSEENGNGIIDISTGSDQVFNARNLTIGNANGNGTGSIVFNSETNKTSALTLGDGDFGDLIADEIAAVIGLSDSSATDGGVLNIEKDVTWDLTEYSYLDIFIGVNEGEFGTINL
ncbi:MAG: beta strand repeat-containing protein [Opitutales bacterium]